MLENEKLIIWDAGELIYEAGSLPKEAYLIVEGYVDIETEDGLKLNRLGVGEIFGETSILLDLPRTVTAKASSPKVAAKMIPKSYFIKMTKSNVILGALIRKTQIRLMDSNKQSNDLANEISSLLDQMDLKPPLKQNELAARLRKVRSNIDKIQQTTEL